MEQETTGFIVNREIYDHKNQERHILKASPGLNEEVIRLISQRKNEPEWMLDKRLKAFEIFKKLKMPDWGPDISLLINELNNITFYIDPDAKKNARSWDDVPEDIKKTFEKLGIPEAERKALSGAGAQYDSQTVYHNLKKEWEDKGVIFEDMDKALQEYPEIVKKYFMTNCVSPSLHKFAALHAAVWSGGTFLYIPENVKVDLPMQAYFRMNAEKMGQFEHTLIIVEKNAQVHYIEGCFTKGAIITKNPDYIPIEEIKVGDKVLTHTGEYKKVYHTQVRPYSGNLYNIKFYGDSTANIEVTEEHPFLAVKRLSKRDRNKKWDKRWLTPKELEELDYLAVPRNKVVEKNESRIFKITRGRGRHKAFTVERKIKLTKEFFRLIGYYLAEGSTSNNSSYLNFSFGSHERWYIDDVKRLLKNIFGIKKIDEFAHKKNHGISIVVSSVEIARIFNEFGTSANKKSIPHWLMLEDPEKQKELIVGYFRGDGNYFNKKLPSGHKELFRINTVSEKLAKQVRDVLFRIGIPSFLNRRIREKPRQPIYTIGISGEYMKQFGDLVGMEIKTKLNNKNRASRFFIDKNYVYVPIRSIKKKFVTDIPVYNFGVEGDESYVAEGVTVHNCSSPRYDESSLHAGCVEVHVKENARARYSSIENWSRNTYNLNTKRAVVDKNGIIEWVNGNAGCLIGDSKVFTNPKGPVDIKSIEKGDKVYVFDEKTNSIKKSIVKAKIFSGFKKVYKLNASGREIEASANHPFLTLVRRKNKPEHKKGFFHREWKSLEKLKEGDLVAITKKLPMAGEPYSLPRIGVGEKVLSKNQYSNFEMNTSHLYNENITIPEKTNEAFMWLMGILLGDGHVDLNANKINIATHEREDYRNHLIEVINKLFNYTVTEKKERYIIINSKVLCLLFSKIGFAGNADTKSVPKWVFSLPENQILALLAGYFDSDGHTTDNALAFTSINKALLEEVKYLGMQVGYTFSNIFKHGDAGEMNILGRICNVQDSWRILFNGKRIKGLPIRCAAKRAKIDKIKSKRNYVSAKGLNFKSKVNDEIGFAKIDKIEYVDIKPTYDIEVEGYHNFIANGLVVHNSCITMLYPTSVLRGENARSDFIGIALAGKGQNQDTGTKVYHLAPNTKSTIKSKSISMDGGITTYRGLLKISKQAVNSKSNVQCDALMMDDISKSNTIPYMEINQDKVNVGHEASVGKISEEQVFYLMSRGLNEEQARQMIVSGFIEPIIKELPMEYAVELNRLIQLEMEGSLG